MLRAALVVGLLVLARGSLAVWLCQADFVAGHAMLVLEQRCDLHYQRPVPNLFIGWVDTASTEGNKVKRRLCCISSRTRVPGREAVSCEPLRESRWQTDLSEDLPNYAAELCIDPSFELEPVRYNRDTSITSNLLRYEDYLKLRSAHLQSRKIAIPNRDSWPGAEEAVFKSVERVMTRELQKAFRDKLAYIGERDGGRSLCCVDDAPLITSAPTSRCLRMPLKIGPLQELNDLELKIKAFMTSDTPLPSDVSCELPAKYFHEPSSISKDMSLEAYEGLIESMGTAEQKLELSKSTEALRELFEGAEEAQFAEISPVRQRVPGPEDLVRVNACAGAQYHRLDLPKKVDRSSNNPFEGAALGIRPVGKKGAVAIVNEEALSVATVRAVGEDTRPHYINKNLCAKAAWVDVPVFELRRELMQLTSRYNGLDLAYTTKLGFTTSYREAAMRGNLYADKDRKDTTCRQLVGDAMVLSDRINKSIRGSEKAMHNKIERMFTWKCAARRYGDGVCDCTCGAWDVDCNPPDGAELTWDNAPSSTSCPHQAMRCGPIGCSTARYLDLDN